MFIKVEPLPRQRFWKKLAGALELSEWRDAPISKKGSTLMNTAIGVSFAALYFSVFINRPVAYTKYATGL